MRPAPLRAAGVGALVLGADQAIKALVGRLVAPGGREALLPGVDLVNVRNPGVAFGLLGGGGALVLALTVGSLLALLGYFARHLDRPGLWLPTGLLVGGAVGNLVDRVALGEVRDFVSVSVWPAFNVADAAITVGVVVLLVVLERSGRAPARRA